VKDIAVALRTQYNHARVNRSKTSLNWLLFWSKIFFKGKLDV